MADLKISQMQDGGLVEVADEIPVNRAGTNYRVVVGSAASSDADDFATAAQGSLADTAIQPDDLGTAAYENIDYFATAAQGELADTAIQPDDLIASAVSATNTNGLLDTNVQDNINQIVDITNGNYTGYGVLTSGDVQAKMLEGNPFIISGTYAGFTNAPLAYGTTISGVIEPLRNHTGTLRYFKYTPFLSTDLGTPQIICESSGTWSPWLIQNDLPSNRNQTESISTRPTTLVAPYDGYVKVNSTTTAANGLIRINNTSRSNVIDEGWRPTSGTGPMAVTSKVNNGDSIQIDFSSVSTPLTVTWVKSNRTL